MPVCFPADGLRTLGPLLLQKDPLMPNSLILPFTLLLTFSAAQAADTEKWYPSKYGANDEIGALNLLNADSVAIR